MRRPEEEEALEAADIARHAAEMSRAVARHDEEPAPPPPQPEPEPLVLSDQPCPCGSGKPFLQCHGAEDEATV